MTERKIDWPLRVGFLLVSSALFSYMLYEFVNGFINRGPLEILFIYLTDIPQGIGMAFRTAAGLIAVITVKVRAFLPAMHPVVRGVEVEDQFGGRRGEEGDELIHQNRV